MKTGLGLIILTIFILNLSACSIPFFASEPSIPTPTPTLLPPLARAIDISPQAIIVSIPIDPPSFNAYLNNTGYEELIGELVFGSLVDIGPDGQYYPKLATEVPTLENGGLSPDGLTVTWHLRPGLMWSDGVPFTSRDVHFTWEALRNSGLNIPGEDIRGIYAPGFDLITRIERPDDYTVILQYSEFYPNYVLQFGGEGKGIFPAHQCGRVSDMLFWDCNFDPVSIGPFTLAEWIPGQHLVFNPNPTYWRSGRPLSKQLIFVIEADERRRERQLRQGNSHLDLWPEEPQLSNLAEDERIIVQATNPPRFVLQLVPNLSRFGTADPAQPHPLFADVQVRRAIRQAINVPLLIRDVFNNRAVLADTELIRHGCPVPAIRYDPAAAIQTLIEAGWVNFEGQGIRQCQGCLHATEGSFFTFESYHYAEFGELLLETHRQMQQMLLDVGIDMQIKSVEGTELWDTWTAKGLEIRGNFHLDLWDDGYFGVEPTDFLYDLYDPRAIPTRNDPLAGLNVTRYRNPELVTIFDALRTPLRIVQREQYFCQIANILAEDLPTIPLLALPDDYAIHRRLQGISPHIYDTITWNAEDWILIE